jgi:hypothetical protein
MHVSISLRFLVLAFARDGVRPEAKGVSSWRDPRDVLTSSLCDPVRCSSNTRRVCSEPPMLASVPRPHPRASRDAPRPMTRPLSFAHRAVPCVVGPRGRLWRKRVQGHRFFPGRIVVDEEVMAAVAPRSPIGSHIQYRGVESAPAADGFAEASPRQRAVAQLNAPSAPLFRSCFASGGAAREACTRSRSP